MFSESFMKFLIGSQDKENREDEDITEIMVNGYRLFLTPILGKSES